MRKMALLAYRALKKLIENKDKFYLDDDDKNVEDAKEVLTKMENSGLVKK